MELKRQYGCPVEFALHLLGGKWKPVILARIKQQPLRYSQLRKAIPQLSDKVLTQRLDELVESGLVTTRTDASIQVYELTPEGETLRPVLQSLYDWGGYAQVRNVLSNFVVPKAIYRNGCGRLSAMNDAGKNDNLDGAASQEPWYDSSLTVEDSAAYNIARSKQLIKTLEQTTQQSAAVVQRAKQFYETCQLLKTSQIMRVSAQSQLNRSRR